MHILLLFFSVSFWEITESQGKFLMVMFSNVIYFEEYLMEKGAYYILSLSFCSWFRVDPLESFSRE